MCIMMHGSENVKSGTNFANNYIGPAIIEAWRGEWRSTIYVIVWVGTLCGMERVGTVLCEMAVRE
jgi:hypothetical protein